MVRTAPFLGQLVQHVGEGLSVKQVAAGTVLIAGGWPAAQFSSSGRSPVSISSVLKNLALARRILPSLGGLRLLRVWAGPLAVTPDELPVVGEVPGHPGFFVVGGSYGFTLGPLWARSIAALVAGTLLPVELAGFSPQRLLDR
jgi:sarcosine oxidase subunit beta